MYCSLGELVFGEMREGGQGWMNANFENFGLGLSEDHVGFEFSTLEPNQQDTTWLGGCTHREALIYSIAYSLRFNSPTETLTWLEIANFPLKIQILIRRDGETNGGQDN